MHARSTTIQAQPSRIDDGIAHVRDEVLPALQGIDGCIGLSLLVDRTSGRCIATSAWQSEDAMRASADGVRSIRDRAAEMFGGSNPQVEEWEIAVLHRNHAAPDGACVRATWLQGEPGQVDRAIDTFRMATLPAVEEIEGFCSGSLMVNRKSGRAVVSMTYDSMDGLRRSRDRANNLRSAFAQESNAQVAEVAEFELALAHLHVPEMA